MASAVEEMRDRSRHDGGKGPLKYYRVMRRGTAEDENDCEVCGKREAMERRVRSVTIQAQRAKYERRNISITDHHERRGHEAETVRSSESVEWKFESVLLLHDSYWDVIYHFPPPRFFH